MSSLSQLETWSNALAIAAKTLSEVSEAAGSAPAPHLAINNVASCEADRARRNILTIATRFQTQLAEPADLIKNLANQVCRTRK